MTSELARSIHSYISRRQPFLKAEVVGSAIFDAAAELLNTSDPDETLYTLHILAQSQPKGHWRCACLKQKPIRECCNDRIWALHEKFPPPSIAPLLKRVLKQLREDDPRRHPDFNVR
jgi:hypothetical protein